MDKYVTLKLLEEPAPRNFQSWCWQAMMASFPLDEQFQIWGDILEYVGWLDSLPTCAGRDS